MSCLGRHRAGDGSYLLVGRLDRIPSKRVCDLCRQEADPRGTHEREDQWERDVAAARARAMSLNLWQIGG